MEDFEQVLKQYEPMISSILRKTHIYKNRDHFRQVARIALWKAWLKFDVTKGSFANYAYRMMLTSVYTAMHVDNRYAESQVAYEKERLTILSHYIDHEKWATGQSATLDTLAAYLITEEFELLKDLYYHQYKYEELTVKYAVSVAALKKRRDRILQKLRQKLKMNGHTL